MAKPIFDTEGFDFDVETGNITGGTVTEKFSVQLPDGGGVHDVDTTWTFNGLTVERLLSLAWDGAKVKMRAATLKKMSAEQLKKLGQDGEMAIREYISATRMPREAVTKEVKELRAKVNEMMKTFRNIASQEARAELGDGASIEAVQNLADKIYTEKYASLCEV